MPDTRDVLIQVADQLSVTDPAQIEVISIRPNPDYLSTDRSRAPESRAVYLLDVHYPHRFERTELREALGAGLFGNFETTTAGALFGLNADGTADCWAS